MKLLTGLLALLLFVAINSSAQTTPNNPFTAHLEIAENSRMYFVNKMISPGYSEDSQGVNYVLLHPFYTNTSLPVDYCVQGRITAVRGGAGWNRKWSVEVNTSSTNAANRGSIISYNEPTRLVSLVYNGVVYLALEINNTSSLFGFSFTGYVGGATLELVHDEDVSNVQPFEPTDPIAIQGVLTVGSSNAASMFQVHSPSNLSIGKFTFGSVSPTDAYVEIANATAATGSYYASIRGRSLTTGRPLGFGIIGEAEDIVPAAEDERFAAIVLDGRSKTSAPLTNNNVLAICSFGNNLMTVKANGSVGIGTTNTYGNKLAVNGSALFTKVKVKAFASWPDYVFEENYQLPALSDVEKYVQQHKHLPGIPAAAEVKEQGVDLGDMDSKLLQKIEELMLYTISQQKQIEALKAEIEKMKNAQ